MEQIGLLFGWTGTGLIAMGVYNARQKVWRWLRRGTREIIEIPYPDLGVILLMVAGSLLVIMSMLMHLFPNSPEVSFAVFPIFIYRLASHLYIRWLSDSDEPMHYLSEEWQVILWTGLSGMIPSLIPDGSILNPLRDAMIYIAFGIGVFRWLNGFAKSVPFMIKHHIFYLIYLCNVELYPLLGIWSLSVATELFPFSP